ncbi:MAG: hypothetical protein AAGI46_09145 [Planctomycetota bacterium]
MTNCCRFAVIDIDAHGDDDDADANQRAAIACADAMAAEGWRPLLVDSNGKGGFHVWVIFAALADSARVHAFIDGWADRCVADFGLAAKPEAFPKQARIKPDACGNYVRLPGLHQKRPHASRLHDGEAWLEGEDAVDYLLTFLGDELNDPRRLPEPLKPKAKAVSPTPSKRTAAKSRHASADLPAGADWLENFDDGDQNVIDAFTAWCELGHGGDIEDAVRVAARVMGMERSRLQGPVAVDTDTDSPATAPPRGNPYPYPLGAAAFFGPVGDAVRVIAPHSEADPAVLLMRLLSAAGCAIGRGAHVNIDGIEHAARLWPIIAGSTGSGRKGQSWGSVRQVLKLADEAFVTSNIASGLTTGQGLVHSIRDEVRGKPISKAQREEATSNEEGLCEIDPGVSDKRLLVRELELPKVLAAASREGNNLSATLRNAWDGENLREMTRANPHSATDPHVVVQADITPSELRTMLTATEKANGFASRFLFVASRRSKALPFGGDLPPDDLRDVASGLADATNVARRIGRMTWSREARPVWAEMYDKANAEAGEGDGTLAMILARGATHQLRLSVAYAALDGSREIGVRHLQAAAEAWRYCRDSAAWALGLTAAEVGPMEKLFAWAMRQERPPSAAEAGRSGVKPYKGDAALADRDFKRFAEANRGTYAYEAGATKGAMRFRPQPDGYGYGFTADGVANGESVSVRPSDRSCDREAA